jgi:DHA1 family multidrug resistance protein-like MFS transporter
MKDIIRESALGQIIRLISQNRILRYPEEEPDFQNPYEKALNRQKLAEISEDVNGESSSSTPSGRVIDEIAKPTKAEDIDQVDIEKAQTAQIHAGGDNLAFDKVVTSTGHILVTWYTTDDQANPHNWSQRKKGFVTCLIWYPLTLSLFIL